MEIPNPAAKAASFAKEFREFLFKTNVLSLALGVVIGAAVGEVVKSIVDDLLGGILGAVNVDKAGWAALNFSIWKFRVNLGSFAAVLFKFSIVAAVVFMISKFFIRANVPPPPPPTKTCEACKEAIHPDASRCKFCTSEQAKPAAPPGISG